MRKNTKITDVNWTAEITSAQKTKELFSVVVSFYKDEKFFETFTFQRVTRPDALKKLIWERIQQYKKLDDVQPPDLIGPVDLSEFIPVVPPPPNPPTEDELAEAKFINDLIILKQMQSAIDLDIIQPDNATYLSQLTLVRNTFKPRYLQYFS